MLHPGVKMLYFKNKIIGNIFGLVKFKPLNIPNKMSKKGHEARFVKKFKTWKTRKSWEYYR